MAPDRQTQQPLAADRGRPPKLVEDAPGHVAAVRHLVIDALQPGCGGEQTGRAAPATSAPHVATTTVTTTTVSTAPTTTPATRTTTTDPCQNNKGCREDTLAWVKQMVRYDHREDVVLGQYGLGGTVCRAVGIQIQFWNVKITGAVDGYSFDMTSVQHKQVSLDGRKEITVPEPRNLEFGDCSGYLMAVYLGKPLTDAELPARIDFSGAGYLRTDIRFRTDRVAYTHASLPRSDVGSSTSEFLRYC